jgi:prolipoprotein diacylglyceryltransferase
MIWNLAAAAVLVWVLDRRARLSGNQLLAAYAMLYTAGRVWIEMLRIDTVNHIGPFRLNVWTAIMVFTLAATYFVRSRRRGDHERDPRVDASPS